MKPVITARGIVALFLAVLAIYLASFYGIERFRHRSGPWEVGFETNPSGIPSIVISQPSLDLRNARILFHGEAPAGKGATVRFDRVKQAVPFGKVIYEDLTFLPGVVTFDLFGHEIELLPRVLLVDKREIPWSSAGTVELWSTNKPAVPPHPPRTSRRPAARD